MTAFQIEGRILEPSNLHNFSKWQIIPKSSSDRGKDEHDKPSVEGGGVFLS
jgi:hypothetical protein